MTSIFDLSERQVGARCNKLFQDRSEWSTLSNRHIQGVAPHM